MLVNPIMTNSVVTLVLPPARGVVQKKEGGKGGFVQKRRTGDLGSSQSRQGGIELQKLAEEQDQEEEGVYSGVGLGGGGGGFVGGEVEVYF